MAGFFEIEQPGNAGSGIVALLLPRGDFAFEGRSVCNASVEALLAQHTQLDLDHVEPACVLGSVVKFQALRQPARFRCGKGIVQRSGGVRGQIVEHNADPFGRWEVNIAHVLHAVREVDIGTAVGNFDVPPGSVYVDKCKQIDGSLLAIMLRSQ